jgi:UDP-glucose 4-epimerase
VVSVFADRLVNNEPVTIEGTGKQTRDFVYVDDVADAFVRAASRGGGLVCNVGTGREVSVNDLFRMMAADGAEAPDHVDARPGDTRRFSLNIERAAIQLGWKPWTTLVEGTAAVLADRAGRPARRAPQRGGS